MHRWLAKAALPLTAFVFAMFIAARIIDYWAMSKFGNDFGVYWRTANNPIDLAYSGNEKYPFPYMPTMLIWISPLSGVGKLPALLIWTAISILSFVAICRRYLSTTALALALASPPMVHCVLTGQVSAVLAAALLWACGTSNRVMAGIAIGLVATVKPQLVFMAPLMLAFSQDAKAIIGAALSFLVVVGLSIGLFGAQQWSAWLASLTHFQHAVVDSQVITAAANPAAVAARFGMPAIPVMVVGAATGVAISFLNRASDALTKTAAIVTGSILAAPYALNYDLVAVVPFLIVAMLNGRALLGIALAAPHPLPVLAAAYELGQKPNSPHEV